MDINYLKDNYGMINKLLGEWLKNYIRKSEYNPHIAELVIATCSRGMWETYLCLMAYSEKIDENPNDILQSIPFDNIFLKKIQMPINEIKFFNFASKYFTIEDYLFMGLSYSLFLVLAKASLLNRAGDVNCLEECLRKYPNDPRAFWQCMYEKRC